jgi:small subunit ribosomal protein S13
MPRILNVNLPKDKSILIGLTFIKGTGFSRSKIICARLNINVATKLGDLASDNIKAITDFIDNYYMIGNKLNRNNLNNIKDIIKISCYRGFRHVRGLPLRGQRTHTRNLNLILWNNIERKYMKMFDVGLIYKNIEGVGSKLRQIRQVIFTNEPLVTRPEMIKAVQAEVKKETAKIVIPTILQKEVIMDQTTGRAVYHDVILGVGAGTGVGAFVLGCYKYDQTIQIDNLKDEVEIATKKYNDLLAISSKSNKK